MANRFLQVFDRTTRLVCKPAQANDLPGNYLNFKNKIHLSHKLAKIKSTNAGGYELFFDGKNASVKADIVILTLPFTLLREVEMDVDLPDVKRKAIHTLSYGTNSKLLLGFNGRPWRTKYNSVGMSYSDNGTENTWD